MWSTADDRQWDNRPVGMSSQIEIETANAEAIRQYAAAYTAHYVERNLSLALECYGLVRTNHPNSPEAGYARMQIQNIAQSVVPVQELVDAQVKLIHIKLTTN